jgi:hypothetical protein
VAVGAVYLCPGACGTLVRDLRRKIEHVREGEKICL